MTFWKWSQTPADNGTADSSCPWPEGMAPSQVNDSARGQMAALAKYRDDISGSLTTTGTSSAYAVSSNQGFDTLAHLDGAMIAFVPHTDSTAGPTLNVDSLGAKPIRGWTGDDLLAGVLKEGTPYVVFYNNTAEEFILHNYYVNPGEIPIGAGIEYWGTTVPSSNFAFANGAAISRTGYPVCFTRLSTTYGSGDGSTTFNLPDRRGRVSAMREDVATLLTSTYFGTSTSVGEKGGSQSRSLVTANLPPYTPSGSITNGAITVGGNAIGNVASTKGGDGSLDVPRVFGATITASQATSTFTGSAQGGSSTAFSIVQPTIICNYIIRIK